MQVKVANRLYEMSRKEYEGLLQIASENIPFGIYAVEKNGYAELMNIKCSSMTQLKVQKRRFRQQGFKVLLNKGATA